MPLGPFTKNVEIRQLRPHNEQVAILNRVYALTWQDKENIPSQTLKK